MKRTLVVAASAAVMIGALAGGALAVTGNYNPVMQFALKSNPAGTWSYLVSGTLLTKHRTPPGTTLKGWWNGGSSPNSAFIAANKTTSTISWETVNLPPHTIVMDPESEADVSVRWTAPSSGNYEMGGSFSGIDTNEVSHPVAIEQNGITLWRNTISSYGQTDRFEFSFSASAGDTIDFVAGTNGSGNLSTGLKGVIRPG